MKHIIPTAACATLLLFSLPNPLEARGFGAVRGGYAAGARGGAAWSGGYAGGYRGGASWGAGERSGYAAGAHGGYTYGGERGGYNRSYYGGAEAGGARYGSYTGPRGTTVQGAQAGGVAVGPYGGVHAGGAEAARVTTPGGRTYTTGSAGQVGVGPRGGVEAGRVGGSSYRGPNVNYASGSRAGYAYNPYSGWATGGMRGGVAVGGVAGGVAAGGFAYGHSTRYVSPGGLRASGTYVRSNFGYSCFTPTWYRSHTAAWIAPRWFGPGIWAVPLWPTISTYCGITAAPIAYDYGSNVVIDNNNVYVNGDNVATAPQYADQAIGMADRGRAATPAPTEQWQSLGVFGMIQGDEQVAQHIFQLAINQTGVVRGNYYDAVADNTLPVYGSVDPTSQRVAWSIGDKKSIVFETGLNNLTQQQTSVLVHYGKDRTQQMVLVRLEEPKGGE